MITMALTFTIGMLKFKKANAFAFLDTIIILLMVHHKFYDQPMLGNDSTYIPKKNQNQGQRWMRNHLWQWAEQGWNSTHDHAESMMIRKPEEIYNRKLNIKRKSNNKMFMEVSALAIQDQSTHWE